MSGMSAPGTKNTSPIAPFSMVVVLGVSSTASGWRRNANAGGRERQALGRARSETTHEPELLERAASGTGVDVRCRRGRPMVECPCPPPGALGRRRGSGRGRNWPARVIVRAGAAPTPRSSAKKVSPRAMMLIRGRRCPWRAPQPRRRPGAASRRPRSRTRSVSLGKAADLLGKDRSPQHDAVGDCRRAPPDKRVDHLVHRARRLPSGRTRARRATGRSRSCPTSARSRIEQLASRRWACSALA